MKNLYESLEDISDMKEYILNSLDDLEELYSNKHLSYTSYPRSSHNSRESVVKIQTK